LPCCTTYLCEAAFSKSTIKFIKRAFLKGVENVLRPAFCTSGWSVKKSWTASISLVVLDNVYKQNCLLTFYSLCCFHNGVLSLYFLSWGLCAFLLFHHRQKWHLKFEMGRLHVLLTSWLCASSIMALWYVSMGSYRNFIVEVGPQNKKVWEALFYTRICNWLWVGKITSHENAGLWLFFKRQQDTIEWEFNKASLATRKTWVAQIWKIFQRWFATIIDLSNMTEMTKPRQVALALIHEIQLAATDIHLWKYFSALQSWIFARNCTLLRYSLATQTRNSNVPLNVPILCRLCERRALVSRHCVRCSTRTPHELLQRRKWWSWRLLDETMSLSGATENNEIKAKPIISGDKYTPDKAVNAITPTV